MPISALEVIEVLDALDEAGIRVSVAGGWAVDALLGRETRKHGDLDLAVDASLVPRAIEALIGIRFEVTLDQRPARVELHDGARLVDLHPVTIDADGIGRQPGLGGETFAYPPGSMDAVGVIGARSVRCLTPTLIARFHDGYEPRAIDRADMAALVEHFDVELPAAYTRDPGR